MSSNRQHSENPAEEKHGEVIENHQPDWARDLIEHSPILLCTHDLQGHLLSVNPLPARVLGYSAEELLQIPMRELVAPEFRAGFDEYLKRIASDGEDSGMFEVITRAGERRIWEYHNTLRTRSDAAPVVRGVAHDVTERMRIENVLRESLQNLVRLTRNQEENLWDLRLFRTLLDNSSDAIEVVDPETLRFLDVNETGCKELGYSRDELLRMTVYDIDPKIDRVKSKQVREKLRRTGFLILESEHRRKDGSTFPVEVNIRRVQLDRDYVVSISRDISKRREREERLREYERLFEGVSDMVTVVDRDHRYVLANRSFLSKRGMTREEVIGRHAAEILGAEVYGHAIKEKLEESFRGEVLSYPMKFSYPGIGERDLVVTYLPVEGVNGVDRVAAIIRDVTDRERAKEAQRESEERLRLALESAQMGFWEHDHASNTTTRNPRHDQIFGHPMMLPEWTREIFLEHIVPEDREAVKKVMQQNWVHTSFSEECRILWPNQSVHWILTQGRTYADESGKPTKTLGTVTDITEHKRAEEALRESEERMRLAQEAAQIGVFERNMQTGGSRWTPEMENIYGLPPGMAPKTVEGILELIHPGDREQVKGMIEESIEAGTAGGEWRVIWPDGSVRWISGRWRMFKDKEGRPLRALGVDFDITERKRTEGALQASEADLREAQRIAKMGSWRFDVKTQLVTATEQLFRVTGQEPSAAGIPFNDIERFFPPESWQRLVAGTENALKNGKVEDMEISFRRGDGSIGWLLVRSKIDRDEAENIVALHGIALDITERKRAEEALCESEERLRLAQEVAGIGAFDRNLTTGQNRWTPPMGALYGVRSGQFPDNVDQFIELVHPEDRQKMADLVQRSIEIGEAQGEWRVMWPDGSVRWITGRWKVFRDEHEKPVRLIGIDYDVTDRKRIEEELRAAKDRLAEEKLYLEKEIDTELGFEDIIGKSKSLKAVMESAAKVAASDSTVLLLGETGTGKELIARAIHRLSKRSGNAFIKVNCAAIPSGLLESELFGAEKGAFTSSVARKIGRLELADKGTLFLDEIGEITLALQPKLLRVLQDQEFERLGGTRTLKVNFRLIAATNRDLAEEVEQNGFRSDLYYRLNVFPIRIPPLRERREDIPALVEHFVQKISRRMGKSITSIPKRMMNELAAWDWPGNVRELENFVERSVILTNGSVLSAPLGELKIRNSMREELETLDAVERRQILEALRLSRGRISGERGAAERLGLKRTTLQSKLKQMNINPRVLPPF